LLGGVVSFYVKNNARAFLKLVDFKKMSKIILKFLENN
jgi:hypothetical protein